MPKLFITGGAGFLGSRVVHGFVTQGWQVCVFDSFKQYLLPDPRAEQHNLLIRLEPVIDQIEVVQGDTLNRDHMRRTLNRLGPEVIIHMAALPLASMAIEQTEDAFQSILTSTVNLLEIVRDLDRPCRLVYTSSSMVYGDFQADMVTEEHPTNPKDIYGSFKLAGEVIVRGYARCYDLDAVIVRPSAVYGPYDANQRVIQKFIIRALGGRELTVDGDGSMKLDFTFVDDVAQGFYLAATAPQAAGQTFNITRGQARSLAEVVAIIQRVIPEVRIEHRPAPRYMPKRGTLDISKARKMLGYEPKHDLDEGIPKYIEHLRKHPI